MHTRACAHDKNGKRNHLNTQHDIQAVRQVIDNSLGISLICLSLNYTAHLLDFSTLAPFFFVIPSTCTRGYAFYCSCFWLLFFALFQHLSAVLNSLFSFCFFFPVQSTSPITTFGGASEKCPYSRSVLITEVPFECMGTHILYSMICISKSSSFLALCQCVLYFHIAVERN